MRQVAEAVATDILVFNMRRAVIILCFIGSIMEGFAGNQKHAFVTAQDSTAADYFYFTGLSEKLKGNVEDAINSFSRVLKLSPSNHAAWYELGSLYRLQKNAGKAEECALKASSLDRENKWYWLLLAGIYQEKNDMARLAWVFDELIRLEPDNENYYLDKANAFLFSGKLTEASDWLSKARLKFGTNGRQNEMQERIRLAEEPVDIKLRRLEKELKKKPAAFAPYMQLSQLYQKQGNTNKAIALLKKAGRIRSLAPMAHLMMADVYKASGNRAQSLAQLKNAFGNKELSPDFKYEILETYFGDLTNKEILGEAIALSEIMAKTHPSQVRVHLILGSLWAQDGNMPESERAFTRALGLNPSDAAAWLQIIQYALQKGDYRKAAATGEKALTHLPDNAALNTFTGMAYSQLNEHQRAIDLLQRVVPANDQDNAIVVLACSSLASAFHAAGRFSESDAAHERALELEPDNALILNNYAYYLSLRKLAIDKAARMARKANELQPDNASFQDTYAWVLFIEKKYAEAKEWIEKAIHNNPGNATQYEHYGDILFKLGDAEGALKQWKLAKEKGLNTVSLEKKIHEKKYIE